LINIKRFFGEFTLGQFGTALKHTLIGVWLGFLGCKVQQKESKIILKI
jgi:hypothetical protein